MQGRLEREIRLLPQVLACQVTDQSVVVLVAPSADRPATEAAARDLIAIDGTSRSLRVVGGHALLEPVPVRSRATSTPALVGSVVGAAVLATSSLLGGLSMTSPGPEITRRAPAIGAAPTDVRPPPFRPIADAEPEPEAARRRPAPIQVLAQGIPPIPPIVRVAARTAAPATESGARALAREQCRTAPDRAAPRPRRGRHEGNGPRPWSRSILVPPSDSCARGSR